MGSYKWGYQSPNLGYKYSYPTYNSVYIATHEPPSKEGFRDSRTRRAGVWIFEFLFSALCLSRSRRFFQ